MLMTHNGQQIYVRMNSYQNIINISFVNIWQKTLQNILKVLFLEMTALTNVWPHGNPVATPVSV